MSPSVILRQRRGSDPETFATMNADPEVMERLGFSHDERDDFLPPSLEEDHPLRPHVLYRKGAGDLIRPVGTASEADPPPPPVTS